jgi:hypothetical protein
MRMQKPTKACSIIADQGAVLKHFPRDTTRRDFMRRRGGDDGENSPDEVVENREIGREESRLTSRRLELPSVV